MNSSFDAIIALPFGRLGLQLAAGEVRGLHFLPPETALYPVNCALGREVEQTLQAWCAGEVRQIDLPWQMHGTDHQQRVWQLMLRIPYGQTRSYGDVARELGSSPRAVGGACGRNPLPLIVPCHRIIARQGLGGFNRSGGGWLLDIKAWLLQHEQQMAARQPG